MELSATPRKKERQQSESEAAVRLWLRMYVLAVSPFMLISTDGFESTDRIVQ